MAKTIMIQGTASDSGKSFIVAGLCRIFAEDGYKVAPFKAQNMALNSFVTEDGHEIAKSIAVQALCAKTKPDVRMNPVLLKPTSNVGSNVIVNGKPGTTLNGENYQQQKKELAKQVKASFESLSKDYDVIVIEGAGSPAEINLKQNDIVNMGMAKLAGSPVLLAGDIDRGGVFAAVAGTLLLLEEDEKELVKGVIINKFRGTLELLQPGLEMLEEIIHKPVLGVIPHLDINIEKEDSLSQQDTKKQNQLLKIGIIKLPRMTNFTEFDPLSVIDHVGVSFINNPKEIESCDLIIIPGTISMFEDSQWLKEKGFAKALMDYAVKKNPIIGIAEGFGIMSETIVFENQTTEGLGLISAKTIINGINGTANIECALGSDQGLFGGLLNTKFSGTTPSVDFEIVTESNEPQHENVIGIKAHNLFADQAITQKLLENLAESKGISQKLNSVDIDAYYENEYTKLAAGLRESLDMNKIYEILEKGV